MPVNFPVKAAAHSRDGAQTIGIFDSYGYWATLGGFRYEVKASGANLNTAVEVARMLNAAYDQGAEDARSAIREALGVQQED